MRPIRLATSSEVAEASGNDSLLVWAAQEMGPGVVAWALGDAVAVASPDLARRDRLALVGPLADASALARHALTVVGDTFRVIGETALVRAVSVQIPELAVIAEFDWMESAAIPSEAARRADPWCARWLSTRDYPVVAALIDEAFPSSRAHPSRSGFRRWGGASATEKGSPVAVAADAWSAPTVGYVAGVATASAYRGMGAARAVCRFVTEALLEEHGRVALMVESDNAPAIAVYRRLGFEGRPVAGARMVRLR